MSDIQEVNTIARQPEEALAFPFQFADHSLECPAQYDQLRNECPVARVAMPFGGDAYLLTKHEDVIKAFTDPNSGTNSAVGWRYTTLAGGTDDRH